MSGRRLETLDPKQVPDLATPKRPRDPSGNTETAVTFPAYFEDRFWSSHMHICHSIIEYASFHPSRSVRPVHPVPMIPRCTDDRSQTTLAGSMQDLHCVEPFLIVH